MIARLLLAALLIAAAIGSAHAAAQTSAVGASSCSGCHAARKTIDTPVPRLVGRSPADIEAAMTAFRAGQRPSSVMERIAKGFSDDEVKAIAAWYGAQRD
jgi:sulfide dehydrogenase cytochrome subunit